MLPLGPQGHLRPPLTGC